MFRSQILIYHRNYLDFSYSCSSFLSFNMFKDYVSEIKELNSNKVHINNKDNVNKLLNEIVNGGTQKLQVVSDFDRTITKQHEQGKTHLSSFGIFARCKTLPASYLEAEQRLNKKYLPIEVDPNIPYNEKKALIEEWYGHSDKLLKGLKVSTEDIDDVVELLGPSLRDGCVKAFIILNSANVPVLVFSAGLGDAVVAVLKHFQVLLPNVKVVSNFLKRDEDGTIQGFKNKMINVFNKNEFALRDMDDIDAIKDRENVILLGDSLGDVTMADGVPNSNAILKIGFLYDHIVANLPKYKEQFDIVLEDDQTMDVLNAILNILI